MSRWYRSESDPGSPRERYRDQSPGPTIRERSRDGSHRRAHVTLTEKDYRAESSRLYPPDGYYNRRNRKGPSIGPKTMPNRPYPQEYTDDYDDYKVKHAAYKAANTAYRTKKEEYRRVEEESGLTDIFEDKRLKKAKLQQISPTGLYSYEAHRTLRDYADDREDKSYTYTRRREEVFDKWPRINRTTVSDTNHAGSVAWAWGEHREAKRDKDEHDRHTMYRPRRNS